MCASAARLPHGQVIEKQMGRMHPTPSPTWESYIFPDTVEPDDRATMAKQSRVIDLSNERGVQGAAGAGRRDRQTGRP